VSVRSWVAPAFLGIALAVVVEAGIGLLLFVSPGLLPALTTILAVALGSFGVGLGSRPSRRRPESVRWRWFLAVGSLVVAAVLSLGWSFQPDVASAGFVRGVHLALLIALPLYSLGACLATVVHPYDGARSGAAAAIGGMVGVIFLGVVLIPRFEPVSVYLFCVLCVSVAALSRNVYA
jgi:hypothetical protein